MSTKILRILMLVLLVCGAGTVSAQTKKPSSKISLRSYEVPALKPELREMADRILQYRRDSLNKSSVRKANELFLEMAKPLADSVNDMVALGAYLIDNGEYTFPISLPNAWRPPRQTELSFWDMAMTPSPI